MDQVVFCRGTTTERHLEAIRAPPRVTHVGLTSHPPFRRCDGRQGLLVGGFEPPDPNQPRRAYIRWLTPG